VHGAFDGTHILACPVDLRVINSANDVRCYQSRQDAKDHDNHHDFDQGEAAFTTVDNSQFAVSLSHTRFHCPYTGSLAHVSKAIDQ
jgi:hypothetical protein